MSSTLPGGKYIPNTTMTRIFSRAWKEHIQGFDTCFSPVAYSGHCKQLAPEYAKAAQRLAQNEPPYHLAKVDATEQKQVAERFGIKGFPTLFFFK